MLKVKTLILTIGCSVAAYAFGADEDVRKHVRTLEEARDDFYLTTVISNLRELKKEIAEDAKNAKNPNAAIAQLDVKIALLEKQKLGQLTIEEFIQGLIKIEQIGYH